MANLDIRSLSKRFGRVHALKDVTFRVADGEFLILLGPTGAGKTTTLRCVAGLEKPDGGEIVMDGMPLMGVTPADRDVAFVFQNYALYPRKTVRQNMAFPLQARGLSQAEIERTIGVTATKLGIHMLLDRWPAQLSGGQQQRVALGRAMVRQPRLFLMDEPLTNLDFKLRVEMRGELKRLQRELSATFLYVTNDQVEAMSMADRIVVLERGTVQQVDTPETVYNRPANLFVAGFVGSPRMNFIDCQLDPAAHSLVSRDGAWTLPLGPAQMERLERQPARGDYVLGIRAEDIQLSPEPEAGTVPCLLYVVEPLGDRTIVDIQVGRERLKVKVSAAFAGKSGDSFFVRIDPALIHLFDRTSGTSVV
jgi:multiple sugar transport system ATP-binding protein